MDIKEQLVILSEICRQDLKIIKNKENLKKLSHESSEADSASVELGQKIKNLFDDKTDRVKKRRDLDEKLHNEKSNLRKWEARAEKIKGEREYSALLSEIGSLKRAISGIEMEISEVTEALKSDEEKLKTTGGARDEKVNAAQKAYESVSDLLKQEKQELENNQRIREGLLENLPKLVRTKYERIHDRRSLQGIAFLQDAVCQVCMRTVPPELFIRVLKGEVIEQCPSCWRLLVAKAEENDHA